MGRHVKRMSCVRPAKAQFEELIQLVGLFDAVIGVFDNLLGLVRDSYGFVVDVLLPDKAA